MRTFFLTCRAAARRPFAGSTAGCRHSPAGEHPRPILARQFFAQVLGQAERADLLSKEHFSVDGTMIEALASLKSYRPKDEDEPPSGDGGRNPWIDFKGEKRSRDTHESKTDKEALLCKKSPGTAARLCYLGHLLMENRHGLRDFGKKHRPKRKRAAFSPKNFDAPSEKGGKHGPFSTAC